MLTPDEVVDVVGRIEYRNWKFDVIVEGDRSFIQTQDPQAPNKGRMWLIEDRHDASDVVRTAYAAISAVEEHERREFFKFDGALVWDPHSPVAGETDGRQQG